MISTHSQALLPEYREAFSPPPVPIPQGPSAVIKDKAAIVRVVGPRLSPRIPVTTGFPGCADAWRADYALTRNGSHCPKVFGLTKVIPSREFITVVEVHRIPWASGN